MQAIFLYREHAGLRHVVDQHVHCSCSITLLKPTIVMVPQLTEQTKLAAHYMPPTTKTIPSISLSTQ